MHRIKKNSIISNLKITTFLLVLQLQTNWMTVAIPTTYFSGIQELVFELQTNLMMVYQLCIFRTSTMVFLAKQHLHILFC